MIHNILVIKNTGENIYTKSFKEQNWSKDLVSGFISAAFMFSQTTFGANIDTIDVGPYKVLFEESEFFIIVAFFDKFDSIINVRQKLRELKTIIFEKYEPVLLKDTLFDPAEYVELGDIIEKTISEKPTYDIEKDLEEKYIQNLKRFCSSNDEIQEYTLISLNGIPITPEANKELLDLSLRQMESFWKSKSQYLDQIIINFEKRYIILNKIDENLILSVLIRRDTPIGLATLLVEEISEKLASIKEEKQISTTPL